MVEVQIPVTTILQFVCLYSAFQELRVRCGAIGLTLLGLVLRFYIRQHSIRYTLYLF